VTVLFTGS